MLEKRVKRSMALFGLTGKKREGNNTKTILLFILLIAFFCRIFLKLVRSAGSYYSFIIGKLFPENLLLVVEIC